MTYSFRPSGVCSQEMRVELDDQGIIRDLKVVGGCSGNLQGISALVRDMPAQEAIARLPRDLRAVVILRYFTGLTLAETAQALDIPQGTVVTRQRRALALLKLELSDTEEVWCDHEPK